ncbi:hypothetical protein [Amycolatopsis sp. NPDC051061]|uniref:hypothetical protein n=1 Tax=Amycolatopsis sp. NPDC051061 TaxID=3155042 RepID=UPI00342E4D12
MTRARDEGGAHIAARRLLVLAGALAGFWLVSWWLSGHAQAAPRPPAPVGEVVTGVLEGQPSGGAIQAPNGDRSGVAGVVAPVAGAVSQSVRAVAPVSQVVRSAAPVVEPVSQVVRAAAPVVEPVSQAVRSAVPVVEPVSRIVGTAVPITEPAVRAIAPVAEPASQVVRAAAPVVEPLTQVVRTAAPVLDPVLAATRAVVLPVVDSVGGLVEPVADVLSPVTQPVGDVLTPVVEPVVQPIVAPVAEAVDPPAADPAGEPPVRPVRPGRQAEIAPPHQESTPGAVHGTVRTPAQARTYDRPGPSVEPVAAKPRSGHHHTTVSQPVRNPRHSPNRTPEPRSPAPVDATCGTAPTIPAAFLTPGHGPRPTRSSVPPHEDFHPLWRACEPGTGPG